LKFLFVLPSPTTYNFPYLPLEMLSPLAVFCDTVSLCEISRTIRCRSVWDIWWTVSYCSNLRVPVSFHQRSSYCVVSLATGPQPPPKRVLHTVRSSGSSFSLQHLWFFLRSCSSCLCHLPYLLVHYVFPSIPTSFER
jgi:hypothetical protein